jgi:hypothetical protein
MVMNMKALISTIEPVQTGYRVAQVEADSNIFPVADAMFWTSCTDNITADKFWYDPTDQTIKAIPEPVSVNQPTTQGSQTL